MGKLFKLVGLESDKVYFESNDRTALLRWLDNEFEGTKFGTRKNISVQRMPEAMRIVKGMKVAEGGLRELLDYGFEYNSKTAILSFVLSKKKEPDVLQLIIHSERLNQFGIYQFREGKEFVCVSEELLFGNEAGCYTTSKKNYLKFKENFPNIQLSMEII